MRAGCHIEVPREIATKRAVISVHTMDNACFAWSVVAALYPAERNAEWEYSHLHYTIVLNLLFTSAFTILARVKNYRHTKWIARKSTTAPSACKITFIDLFKFLTLGEYSDLYLKTDVLLLADIFENFRESCVASYGLDSAHYYTLPKNDFEKNLYKLMNNAVFGKTMENVRNHVDVKLLTKWHGRYGAEAMIAKPNFHSRSVFAENLIAIEMRKLEVKFDKPIYMGMCILDISKVCLYEFHHEYMLPLFRDKCKIMYTDTDHLIYRVECEDVYETMKCDISRFDTSDYPTDNAYGIPLANKKVPGLMKDENNDAIMTEFVGLRAKMYAVRVDSKKDTKKVKGNVKSNVVARTITFDDYTRCLNEEIEMTRRQSCIRSKLHEVYTISESKIALSPYDDKRYVVPDSTETLSWEYWRISL
ncbi:hypothetical protein ALC57_18699 [Trachymyrmex cornetzi]|uniref:DNA-directed DNA polymerase n=1 Tax=Trachymyrmex cornetzi TaxID=471704 RepID=A0A151IRE5_9HYME|nr:hypothetical protein ALC57_18699 [Trachymyrmex cornetzi]